MRGGCSSSAHTLAVHVLGAAGAGLRSRQQQQQQQSPTCSSSVRAAKGQGTARSEIVGSAWSKTAGTKGAAAVVNSFLQLKR
jgi:hypothetical protein